MKVAELIARALRDRGVQRVWGMPGGDSLPLVKALQEEGLEFVLVRNETSAAFAAQAAAQLTGAPGVCLATLGPGLTNMITGVAGATLDRHPVLALTSRYKTDKHATYTHMMLDQTPMMEASAKRVIRMTAKNAASELSTALQTANAPRQGAVWLEIPTEVSTAPTAPGGFLVAWPSASEPSPSLAKTIASWKRPVVLAGYSARHADLAALADTLRVPVITTYKAKGAIPESHPFSAGAAGLSPKVDAIHRKLLSTADGILLLGWDTAELRDHWMPGWGGRSRVIAFDEVPPVDVPARVDAVHLGPLDSAIAKLTEALDGQPSTWTPEEVAEHRASWQALFEEDGLGPATAIRAVQAAADEHTICALDVGAHRITASHVWQCEAPDRLLQSNGLSSMGYGLPAALASAAEGHPTVAIVGDMGMQMTLGELAVAQEHNWPLVVVVLVDGSLSLIELKQERVGGKPEGAVRFGNPDWKTLARAFGWTGITARSAEHLTEVVQQALQRKQRMVVAAPVDPAFYRNQM